MPEPLTADQLQQFSSTAAILQRYRDSRQDTIYASQAWRLAPEQAITQLVQEVQRLRGLLSPQLQLQPLMTQLDGTARQMGQQLDRLQGIMVDISNLEGACDGASGD